MAMSPFRRSVKAETQRRSGKGKGGGNWYDRYRIPQESPAAFVFINSEYVDHNPPPEQVEIDPATGRPKEVKTAFFKFRKHRVKLNQNEFRDEICSAGHNPHNPQPCVGCYHMDQGDRRVTVADNFAFGIVHLAPYHRHPLIDRNTGGVVMKRDSNPPAPVTIDTECTGPRNCNFCRVLSGQPPVNDPRNPWPNFRPQDIQTVFGKRRYLEIGKSHLGNLEAWEGSISTYCGNDGAQLIIDAYLCPHCGGQVIDMNNDQRTDAQIQEAVSKPYPCIQCNRPVMLREVVACDACEAANRQPVQFSMFAGRVVFGIRQGEGTQSQLVLQRHMSLDEFARSIDPRFLNGRTMAQIVEDLAKPYDFEKVFSPKDLAGQSQRLGLPAPSGFPQAPQGMYGNAPQQQYPQAAPPPAAPQQPQFAPYPGQQPQAQPGPAPFVPPTPQNFNR